jgi:hypothetical protein
MVQKIVKESTNQPKKPKGHFHTAGAIATPAELQEMWTECINDIGWHIKDRLKASELLGKSLAMFTEKSELSGKVEFEGKVIYEVGIQDVT